MAASLDHATLLPSRAEDLQNEPSMEVTMMTSSEVRRYVEEDEQLTSSCYITAKPSKWVGLDIYSCVKPST